MDCAPVLPVRLFVRVDDKCGSIMLGRDADFVAFNPDLTLVETYVGGNSFGSAFTEWLPK